MVLPIGGSGPREAASACGLVVLAGVAACVLRAAFGPVGCVMILLAPVVGVGLLYGVRTALTTAALAYLVYAFMVAEPFHLSMLSVTGRNLTAPAFVLSALIAGGFAPVLRRSRRGAAPWSQTTRALIEATAFFNVTPNEDAIRQKLVETISAMTRTATVVTDRDGRLRFRAGAGSERMGSIEDELEDFAYAMIRQPQDQVVTKGEFRGRLIRTPDEVQGAVIWRRPGARINAADELVDLLVDLASAAIARSGRDRPVQTRSSIS